MATLNVANQHFKSNFPTPIPRKGCALTLETGHRKDVSEPIPSLQSAEFDEMYGHPDTPEILKSILQQGKIKEIEELKEYVQLKAYCIAQALKHQEDKLKGRIRKDEVEGYDPETYQEDFELKHGKLSGKYAQRRSRSPTPRKKSASPPPARQGLPRVFPNPKLKGCDVAIEDPAPGELLFTFNIDDPDNQATEPDALAALDEFSPLRVGALIPNDFTGLRNVFQALTDSLGSLGGDELFIKLKEGEADADYFMKHYETMPHLHSESVTEIVRAMLVVLRSESLLGREVRLLEIGRRTGAKIYEPYDGNILYVPLYSDDSAMFHLDELLGAGVEISRYYGFGELKWTILRTKEDIEADRLAKAKAQEEAESAAFAKKTDAEKFEHEQLKAWQNRMAEGKSKLDPAARSFKPKSTPAPKASKAPPKSSTHPFRHHDAYNVEYAYHPPHLNGRMIDITDQMVFPAFALKNTEPYHVDLPALNGMGDAKALAEVYKQLHLGTAIKHDVMHLEAQCGNESVDLMWELRGGHAATPTQPSWQGYDPDFPFPSPGLDALVAECFRVTPANTDNPREARNWSPDIIEMAARNLAQRMYHIDLRIITVEHKKALWHTGKGIASNTWNAIDDQGYTMVEDPDPESPCPKNLIRMKVYYFILFNNGTYDGKKSLTSDYAALTPLKYKLIDERPGDIPFYQTLTVSVPPPYQLASTSVPASNPPPPPPAPSQSDPPSFGFDGTTDDPSFKSSFNASTYAPARMRNTPTKRTPSKKPTSTPKPTSPKKPGYNAKKDDGHGKKANGASNKGLGDTDEKGHDTEGDGSGSRPEGGESGPGSGGNGSKEKSKEQKGGGDKDSEIEYEQLPQRERKPGEPFVIHLGQLTGTVVHDFNQSDEEVSAPKDTSPPEIEPRKNIAVKTGSQLEEHTDSMFDFEFIVDTKDPITQKLNRVIAAVHMNYLKLENTPEFRPITSADRELVNDKFKQVPREHLEAILHDNLERPAYLFAGEFNGEPQGYNIHALHEYEEMETTWTMRDLSDMFYSGGRFFSVFFPSGQMIENFPKILENIARGKLEERSTLNQSCVLHHKPEQGKTQTIRAQHRQLFRPINRRWKDWEKEKAEKARTNAERARKAVRKELRHGMKQSFKAACKSARSSDQPEPPEPDYEAAMNEQFPEPEPLPEVEAGPTVLPKIAPYVAFGTILDYLLNTLLAATYDAEHLTAMNTLIAETYVRVLDLGTDLFLDTRRTLALIDPMDEFRLTLHDVFEISFSDSSDPDDESYHHGSIQLPLPYSNLRQHTAILSAYFDKGTNTYRSIDVEHTTESLDRLLGPEAAKRAIANCEAIPAKVTQRQSDAHFRHAMNAAALYINPKAKVPQSVTDFMTILTGNQAMLWQQGRSIYGDMDPVYIVLAALLMHLNAGQMKLFRRLLNTHGPFIQGSGPAGTGKTHTLLSAWLPFFLEAAAKGRFARMPGFSTVNLNVNHMCKEAFNIGMLLFEAGITDRPAMICRPNNKDIDSRIANRPAEERKQQVADEENKRPSYLQTTDGRNLTKSEIKEIMAQIIPRLDHRSATDEDAGEQAPLDLKQISELKFHLNEMLAFRNKLERQMEEDLEVDDSEELEQHKADLTEKIERLTENIQAAREARRGNLNQETADNFDTLLDAEAAHRIQAVRHTFLGPYLKKLLSEHAIDDERQVLLEFSVGRRILEAAGILTPPKHFEFFVQKDKFADFRDMFNDKANNTDWDENDQKRFNELYDQVYEYVYRNSDLIGTTTFNAGAPKYMSGMQAGWADGDRCCPVALIDEVAKITQSDIIPIVTHLEPSFIVQIGDMAQVTTHLTYDNNPLAAQQKLLLPARLQLIGIPVDYLWLQQRYPSCICVLLSALLYEGRLSTHPEVANRPNVIAARAWVAREYENGCLQTSQKDAFIPDNLIMASILGGEEFKTGTTYANQWNANLIYKYLVAMLGDEELMAVIPASEIVVITAYSAQVTLFAKVIQAIAEHYPELRERAYQVGFSTFDAYIGLEKDIVIVCTTRTTDLGFMKAPARINLAISRAKALAVMVSYNKHLQRSRSWRGTVLAAITSELKRRKAVIDVPLDTIDNLEEVDPNEMEAYLDDVPKAPEGITGTFEPTPQEEELADLKSKKKNKNKGNKNNEEVDGMGDWIDPNEDEEPRTYDG